MDQLLPVLCLSALWWLRLLHNAGSSSQTAVSETFRTNMGGRATDIASSRRCRNAWYLPPRIRHSHLCATPSLFFACGTLSFSCVRRVSLPSLSFRAGRSVAYHVLPFSARGLCSGLAGYSEGRLPLPEAIFSSRTIAFGMNIVTYWAAMLHCLHIFLAAYRFPCFVRARMERMSTAHTTLHICSKVLYVTALVRTASRDSTFSDAGSSRTCFTPLQPWRPKH